MGYESILIKQLRIKKAQERAEKEAALRYRQDNMHLIVKEFNVVLAEELEPYGVRVYINETQNNVDCPNGDKFWLTASKIHSDIRVVYRVKPNMPSADYMKIFREQTGLLKADVAREAKDGSFHVRFMCPQEDVGSTIGRILTRVPPLTQGTIQ